MQKTKQKKIMISPTESCSPSSVHHALSRDEQRHMGEKGNFVSPRFVSYYKGYIVRLAHFVPDSQPKLQRATIGQVS